MADTERVRKSWGNGLSSLRLNEPEDEVNRNETPVFVLQAPSATARRHSISAVNLSETHKQRNALPISTFGKVSNARDRSSSAREEFMELRRDGLALQEYKNAYEKAKVISNQDAQAQQVVFGSQEAIQESHAMALRRRRRMSLGSQLEFFQSQLKTHTQPQPKSSMKTAAAPQGNSFFARTAPSSRSNSVPKVRPDDNSENLHPLGTARVLHFDRLSESLPNFKPSKVKPDLHNDSVDIALTNSTFHCARETKALSNVRTSSKSELNTPSVQSPRGKQNTPTKYLTACSVAERLAKAICGGSKSSKNKVDLKLALPCLDNREAPGMSSDDGSSGKCVDQWPEAYSCRCNPELALDQSSIYADLYEKSQISSFRFDKMKDSATLEEKEIDMLKSWLDGMKQQGEGVYDDLEKKAKATCMRLEMLDDKQAMLDDRQLCLNDFQSNDKLRSSDIIAAVQQRLRRMHKETKSLALEAASELRRRISERSAAREVFGLMKREMDAYAKVLEKEKVELQSKLEDEIARRESSWAGKLDRIRSEERELRERVMNLREENSYVQKELSTLLSTDRNTKEKVKELETQVDVYCTRAELAKAELDALHQAYDVKESETHNLRRIVERLSTLCSNYKNWMSTLHPGFQDGQMENHMNKSGSQKPSKLQCELSRLSSLEVALRSEMQVFTGSPPDLEDEQSATRHVQRSMEDMHSKLDRLESQLGELQDDNNILSVKLRLATREKEAMRKALKIAREEIQELQEERHLRRGHGQEDFAQECSEMLLGAELEGDADSQESRQVTAYHARLEATNQFQVQESQFLDMKYKIGKQDNIIRGLEHSLAVASNAVEAQKLCIMRLFAWNEELVRLYHSKENEVQGLRVLSSTKAEGMRVCEQELDLLKEQAFKWKQDIRAQDLNCKILKEKLSSREFELAQQTDNVTALEHQQDWLEAEVKKLQRLLGEANRKATTLQHQCEEQKVRIKNLQVDVEGHVKELIKLKDILPRVLKERDDLSQEAEQIGREALKLSAEVEVLRRKVLELDKDVMVRDGQITILCHSLEEDLK